MIGLFDIASYEESIALKRMGFNLGTRMYYHTHYDNYYDNIDSLESTGDWSYSFYNKNNQYRAAAPYYWQFLLWGVFHPHKAKKIYRAIIVMEK